MIERALNHLNADPIFNMDMIYVIHRGTGEVLAADAGGVLLYETESKAFMMTVKDLAHAEKYFDSIESAQLFTVHQAALVERVEKLFHMKLELAVCQAVWTKDHMIDAPVPDFPVGRLSMRHIKEVCGLYSHDLGEEYLADRLRAGDMYGVFDGSILAGFIGLHAEGSMGMLEVAPSHRKRGIGKCLLKFLSNMQIERGRVPFSQISEENAASFLLHEKLGFAISDQCLFWLTPAIAQAATL